MADPPLLTTRSDELAPNLACLVPAGSHAYSKAADQWPAVGPRILAHGRGSKVWDVDGNGYVDWFPGLSSVSLGHAYPAVAQAVISRLERGHNFQLPTMAELEAASEFLETIALAEMVKFAKDGSTVNGGALRLARFATGRLRVAKCREHPFFSYDDWFIGTTRRCGGVVPAVAALTLEFGYNDADSLAALFSAYPDEIAAVILEPVRFDEPDPVFFPEVRRLCNENGTLLILDEIVTGMKYHLNGAQRLYGIKPDLTTWGKGIANGFPLAALTGPRHLMRLGDTTQQDSVFLLSTTFGSELVSLAAMQATIGVFAADDVIGSNYARGAALREGLNTALSAAALEPFIEFVGRDCFFGVVTRDEEGAESRVFRTLLFQELIRRGVLFRGIFYPTLSHSDEDVERTVIAFADALSTYAAALESGPASFLVGKAIQPGL
jgi:glutamate-1-semialdehyde 2,1-aminomutase